MNQIQAYGKGIKAELKQITWPNRKELLNKTLIVLGMSGAVTAIVVAADLVSSLGFQLVLKFMT